ncbi:MAG TPA: hypothetical protein VF452_01435, partial [Candidatus Binatia bacterium]
LALSPEQFNLDEGRRALRVLQRLYLFTTAKHCFGRRFKVERSILARRTGGSNTSGWVLLLHQNLYPPNDLLRLVHDELSEPFKFGWLKRAVKLKPEDIIDVSCLQEIGG